MGTAIQEHETETLQLFPLIGERCDRCPARAKALVMVGDYPLYFCGHHTNQYAETFDERGYLVIWDDEEE